MNKDVIEQERQRLMGLGVTDSRRFVPFWDERRQRKAMPSEATEALKQNANERMEKRIGEMHEYAKRFYRSQGNFPTITDFMKVLSIASKNTVSYHLSEMESRGLIVRIGGKGTTGRYTLPEVLEALKSL
jgi:Fic family protein